MKHDFGVSEYLVVDPDDESYAKNTKEADERWRQNQVSVDDSVDGPDEEVESTRAPLHKRYDPAIETYKEMTKARVYGVYMNAFSTALDPHSLHWLILKISNSYETELRRHRCDITFRRRFDCC